MNATIIILLSYLILVFSVAWYFSRNESLNDYFVNSGKTNLLFMTLSTVATVVGAGATVAIVSEVYNSGISYGLALPISFITGMLILGIMAKKMKAIGDEYNVYTIVDFFAKRFDAKNEILTGILQIFLLTVWVAVQAIAITSLTSVLVGFEYEISLILSAIVVVLYTAIGGLKIDIITDFIQFWIILIVFLILAILGYSQIGGFSNLLSHLPQGHLNPFGFGGIGWMIGVIVLSGFVYLGNTTHWQRIFSAENQSTARNSFFWSIPLVALISLIVLFLGLIASVLLPGIKQETAIFSLMDKILPSYLVGIGFASILAVIMSSVDSLLIGGSTIIYKGLFKKTKFESKKEIIYARLITALFGFVGFLLAFVIPNIVTLSLFVTYLSLIFVPAIIAGIYSKKTSSNASFYSILIPAILLLVLYPIFGKNTFAITSPLGILMIIFYDKIFKRSTQKL